MCAALRRIAAEVITHIRKTPLGVTWLQCWRIVNIPPTNHISIHSTIQPSIINWQTMDKNGHNVTKEFTRIIFIYCSALCIKRRNKQQHPACPLSHLATIETIVWFIDSFHGCLFITLKPPACDVLHREVQSMHHVFRLSLKHCVPVIFFFYSSRKHRQDYNASVIFHHSNLKLGSHFSVSWGW